MITCEYCGTRTHDYEQAKCLSCGANLPALSMVIPLGACYRDFNHPSQNFLDPVLDGVPAKLPSLRRSVYSEWESGE